MGDQTLSWSAWYVQNREDIGILLGLVGIILSLGGFGFAIYQIYQVKSVALAAKTAANNARRTISRSTVASEGALAAKFIDEIKIYLQVGKLESALIRLADLSRELIQLHERFRASESDLQKIKFTAMSTQVATVRDQLERHVADSGQLFDAVWAQGELSGLAESVNRMIGIMKMRIEKGESDAGKSS